MKKVADFMVGFCLLVCLLIATPSFAQDNGLGEEAVRKLILEVIQDNPKILYDTISGYVREQQAKQRKQNLETSLKNRIKEPVSVVNPSKGPAEATITIVEYSDFECSFCSKGAKTMEQVLKRYPNQVRLVYKNNPLEFHENAMPAAMAALAADRQGKFWPYHDELFKNYQNLSEGLLTKIAGKLGLDMERFEADRNSEVIQSQVEAEIQSAKQKGLSGTPAFIVNGVIVSGAQPLGYFVDLIERLLKENEG